MSCGLFKCLIVIVYGVVLNDDECVFLVEYDVWVVYNLNSNLKLGFGIVNVKVMLEVGIKVGIVIDSVVFNNNLDMFEEMCIVILL